MAYPGIIPTKLMSLVAPKRSVIDAPVPSPPAIHAVDGLPSTRLVAA